MIGLIREIRDELLKIAHVSQAQGYECVIMPGSGTFSVESVISSVVPPPSAGGRLLVITNGAYGKRIATMAKMNKIEHDVLSFGVNETVDPAGVTTALQAQTYTHVAVVHHETTTGTLNDIDAIGKAVRAIAPDASYIVDSMSAFGAYDVDIAACDIDYIVSSANKNLEGVPGFAFVLCKKEKLLTEGVHARTLSLDLLGQWKGLETNGQFRFTPPTHALLAFRQALREHEAEGGVAGRGARYEANFQVLKQGMRAMGFELYLDETVQGNIISTFLFPEDANFDFPKFYSQLSYHGCVIYPGKLTEADSFRIGSIGRLFESDMQTLVLAIKNVLTDLGVTLPVTQQKP